MDTSDIEYRLYHDENGELLYYMAGVFSEKEPGPEGTYIVIDVDTYTLRINNVIVVNGKVKNKVTGVITKLVPGKGLKCASEDVSIIVNDDYTNITEWRLKIREL